MAMPSTKPLKKGRVRWDEENLTQNEQLKREINATAIEEPKTPYHSPCSSKTDLRGIPPPHRPRDPPSAELEVEFEEYQRQLDEEIKTAGLTQSDDQQMDGTKTVSRRVSFGSDTKIHDATETEGDNEFFQHRREHYSMKEALQRGKELMKDEEPQS